MRLIIVGPGRAGGAIAIAASNAGHEIAGILARTPEAADEAARRFGSQPLAWDEPLSAADVLVVAVRDGAIETVADRLAPTAGAVAAAVHLSGLVPVDALGALAAAGLAIGSFHPLQTLPTAEVGAARLAGASVAVTAHGELRESLHDLGRSLGVIPFDLDDGAKPLYHAAAVAAANVPIASLAVAADLLRVAGVSFDHTRALVDAVVANAFELGPRAALTGPVVRGDAGTLAAHIAAISRSAPEWEAQYRSMIDLVAAVAGTPRDDPELSE